MVQTAEQRRLTRLVLAYNKKAGRLGLPGALSASDLARKPMECFYCGIGLEVGQGTFDHVILFDRGGPNTPDNVVRCCTTCNRTKFNKTPAEFQAHKDLVIQCEVCGKQYQPRWGEYINGRARTCSLSCAAKKRWK